MFFFISVWGFGKSKGLVLPALWKWYCICKYCNDSSSGNDKKMYCISYLSSCFINCYFLYSYCRSQAVTCTMIVFSSFDPILCSIGSQPVCSQYPCLLTTVFKPFSYRMEFPSVLPSPVHLMVLLVFVLDGVTELRMKGFILESGLWHACFCCNV